MICFPLGTLTGAFGSDNYFYLLLLEISAFKALEGISGTGRILSGGNTKELGADLERYDRHV